MRYLFISILVVLFSGCKVATVENYIKSEVQQQELILNTYFSDAQVDYVYKADIAVYGNEFSGILILKKIAPEKHRMVFTSQFGSTFFDIELYKDSHKINTIVKQLDRKIILNTLIRDFSLLVAEKGIVTEKYYDDTYSVLKNKTKKRNNYYFYTQSDQRLNRIIHTTRRNEKFSILFNDVSMNNISKQVQINHNTIKLNIKLNLLKK